MGLRQEPTLRPARTVMGSIIFRCSGRRDACRNQGLLQHGLVPNVVGQQQHQFGIELVAAGGVQIAVGVDQGLVEIVRRL
jgi:hypothetical protein